MWQLATQEINTSLYRENIHLFGDSANKSSRLLTAYPPYNEAHANPCTPEIRHKLFISYEQLDNKNWSWVYDTYYLYQLIKY